MSSRKHNFFDILNHVVMDGMERDKLKAAQQGPLPRYMARLDAAEAVCEYANALPLANQKLAGLLAAWRKAMAASEEK